MSSGRLRLVHASRRGTFKLFERVQGALLEFGAALEPGLRVEHSYELAGRTRLYTRSGEPPPAPAQIRVSHASEYRIVSARGELGRIAVSDDAVRSGHTLQLARKR